MFVAVQVQTQFFVNTRKIQLKQYFKKYCQTKVGGT